MRPCLCLLLALAAAALAAADRPRLIFSVNPGRSGSAYTADLLNATEAFATHEWRPNVSGRYLRWATLRGLEATAADRAPWPQVVRERAALHAPGPRGVFADTTNMFAKTQADLAARFLAPDFDISVVVLRRYLPAVLLSLRRLGFFHFPNAVGLQWHYTSHAPAPEFSLVPPPCAWEECTATELIISYLIETEARGEQLRARHDGREFRFVDARLESLVTLDGARALVEALGLRYDAAELAGFVGELVDTQPRVGRDADRCAALVGARNDVLAYVRKARRQGIRVPALPGMVPVNEPCQAQLAAEPTEAELDAALAPDVVGEPLQIVWPADGEYVRLDELGRLVVKYGVNLPLPAPRAPLHVQRRWRTRFELVGGGAAEYPTTNNLREAALLWANGRGEPADAFLNSVPPGNHTFRASIGYRDLLDDRFECDTAADTDELLEIPPGAEYEEVAAAEVSFRVY